MQHPSATPRGAATTKAPTGSSDRRNLPERLRTQSLQIATAVLAGLFAVGSLLGLRPFLMGTDPPAFLSPLFASVMNFVAWRLVRAGRELFARRVFVVTSFLYFMPMMMFAPFTLRFGLGFPLAMLTLLLFHLTHPARAARRIGFGLVLMLVLGYVAQGTQNVQLVLDWEVLTSAVAQLLALEFSNYVLARLGQGWLFALDEAAQARAQMAEAHRMALEASQAKSKFLASMSHELRTPLNAVIGYSELVREELEDVQTADPDDVGRIQKAGKHLLGLVNQVLDLARIEAGKLSIDAREVRLDELARDVSDILRPQLLERQNRLVLDLHQVSATTLDPLRTRQILTNLIGNAAKFTQGGTVCVTVTEAHGRLRAEVADDGPGIPTHRLEQIFAPFEQADDSVQRTHGGTGLGLAISRRLAREMGGDLWAVSEVGHGATFILELPGAIEVQRAV